MTTILRPNLSTVGVLMSGGGREGTSGGSINLTWRPCAQVRTAKYWWIRDTQKS